MEQIDNKHDIEWIKALGQVKNNGLDLSKLDEKFCDDKEIVLAAIQENALALEYASDRLKADKEVVLKAIKNFSSWLKKYDCGYTPLMFAGKELKNDREIVFEAMNRRRAYFLFY